MLRGRVQGVLGVSRALGPVEFWPLLMGRRGVIASRSTCHCCRLGRIPAVRHARADGGRRPSASRRHPAARFRRRVADPQRQMHRGPAAGTAVRGALPCSLTAGLWGVVSDGDACTLAARAPSAQAAAQALVDEAARRGSGDNVTVIAVRLPGGVPAAASGG